MNATGLKLLGMGALLGFSLSRIGFTSWDEVNAMFTFRDLRMFLAFAVGVTLLTIAFGLVARVGPKPAWAARPIHRGTLLGGVLFGLGWALSGACPGVILTQLGEGRFYALFSLVGVALGNWAYGALLERRLGTAPSTRSAPVSST
jgi:uncharacterized membrane protein YedE/YeeE